ncbi:hypothetical protein K469DRAFT_779203 [Zopfia rhizophila CBS 207.26]|uniref:Uncharacterized protein n=1 Tax=Zopfia rhizophila CBS 207.26 TaxID=1314779 RepID=A0A6A6E032_9PEZI|nr:hypothetical protein K469DRAFT_779203 [Zopfia rhizophila CBS 207.26]
MPANCLSEWLTAAARLAKAQALSIHSGRPTIHKHIREMEKEVGFIRAILIEDGASVHTTGYIQAWHA